MLLAGHGSERHVPMLPAMHITRRCEPSGMAITFRWEAARVQLDEITRSGNEQVDKSS
jgi:hypothetical protein